MDSVLKYRNEIYGFLALWILFFHVESRVGMAVTVPLLTPFVQLGNVGVDVFLFLSGFCLTLSLKKDDDTIHFYTKRFKRVAVTYLIISVPFFIWKSIEEIESMRVAHFFYDLSGLSFWLSGCQNAWFVEAILVFYLITPAMYFVVRRGKIQSFVLLTAIYLLNICAYKLLPAYQQSAIAWTRLPIFALGLIMGCYFTHFEIPKSKVATWVFCVLGVVFLFFVHGHLNGFRNWLMYAALVIPALWILRSIFPVLPEKIRNIFASLGKVSLEIYLVHIMTLHIFTFYGWHKTIGQWMYVLLPAISLPVSLLVPRVSRLILTKNNK